MAQFQVGATIAFGMGIDKQGTTVPSPTSHPVLTCSNHFQISETSSIGIFLPLLRSTPSKSVAPVGTVRRVTACSTSVLKISTSERTLLAGISHHADLYGGYWKIFSTKMLSHYLLMPS